MLKKISGYTTKFLFYVKNNFLSFLFKSSVFLTLLTLLYLVCVLKQSNSGQKNPQIEVQQVARSQKLTLRIPTTTETPAIINNFIPKTAHSYFPTQEQTTSSIMFLDTTSPIPNQEPITYSGEVVDTLPLWDYTTPVIVEPSSLQKLRETTTSGSTIDEDEVGLFNERSTPPIEETTLPTQTTCYPNQDQPDVTLMPEELLSSPPTFEETTSENYAIDAHPFFPIQEQWHKSSLVEESDIYSPTLDLFNTDTTESIETTSSLPSQEQTTPLTVSEETTEACNEEEMPIQPKETTISNQVAPFKRSLTLSDLRLFDTNVDAISETTTDLPLEMCEIEDEENTDVAPTDTTTNAYQESDEIAATEMSTPCITELPEISDLFGVNAKETDSLLPTDNSPEIDAETEPEPESDSLFQDEENEFGVIEAPTIDSETDCLENHESAEVPNADAVVTDSHEDRLPSSNSNPFDFQNNLFNLFSFDHVPETSNIKPTRWSNPETAQQPNAITQIADSPDEVNVSPRFLRRFNRYRQLDSLMNMRIKDSVSLLERLFGNFLT